MPGRRATLSSYFMEYAPTRRGRKPLETLSASAVSPMTPMTTAVLGCSASSLPDRAGSRLRTSTTGTSAFVRERCRTPSAATSFGRARSRTVLAPDILWLRAAALLKISTLGRIARSVPFDCFRSSSIGARQHTLRHGIRSLNVRNDRRCRRHLVSTARSSLGRMRRGIGQRRQRILQLTTPAGRHSDRSDHPRDCVLEFCEPQCHPLRIHMARGTRNR